MIPSQFLSLLLLLRPVLAAASPSITSLVSTSAAVHQQNAPAEPQTDTDNSGILPGVPIRIPSVLSSSTLPASDAEQTASQLAPSTTDTTKSRVAPESNDGANALDPSQATNPINDVSDIPSFISSQIKPTQALGENSGTTELPKSSSNATLSNLLNSGSSGNPLEDISNLLHGVTGLLSPNLLSDLEEVVHDAAYLLKGKTTPGAKNVLDGAAELLTPSSAQKIIGAVHVLQGIITPEVVSEIQKVNLAEVLKEVGTVYTTVKSVLNDYGKYVPDNIAKDLESIVNTVASLLNEKTVKDIEGIVASIDNLLSPEVINSLKTVLSDIGPLISNIEPLLQKVKPIISDISPLFDQVKPIISDIAPLIDKIKPAIEDIKPLFNKIESLFSKVGHYLEEYLTEKNISNLGTLIDNIESLVGAISGVVTPQLFDKIKNGVSSAKGYFTPEAETKLKNILSTVWSMLTPEGFKKAAILVNGLESLLTPEAIQDIRNVGGLAAPYLTEDSINKVKSMVSNVTSYASGFLGMGKETWSHLEPDLEDVVSDAEAIWKKLNIVGDWLGPFITPQNLSKIGDFANETSGLIDTASGLLNPNLLNEVDDIAKSVEGVLSPHFFNETASLLGSVKDVRLTLAKALDRCDKKKANFSHH